LNRKNYYCGIVLLATVGAGVASIFLLRRAKRRKISMIVADAGYETAHDIHFPLKHNKVGKF